MSSTGRNSCPPAWVSEFTSLVEALISGGGLGTAAATCTNLALTPLVDGAGAVVAYASVVYSCADGVVTTLYFDSGLNILASAPAGATVGVGGAAAV